MKTACRRLAVAFLAGIAAIGAAHAQKIPSTEAGIVIFALESQEAMSAATTLSPGDVAWTEVARPALVVRLLDDAEERTRPRKAAAVPAGTLLFVFRLSSGDAYCAPIDPESANGRVQCFRDLDDDGTFDAGYITRSRQPRSHYTPSFVHGIMSVPKYRYEKASFQDAEPIELPIVYRGMKDGEPVFRVEFENNRNIEEKSCEAVSEGVCSQLGRTLEVAPAAGGDVSLKAGERQQPFVLALRSKDRR